MGRYEPSTPPPKVHHDRAVASDARNRLVMELFSRRRRRLISDQVVSCCVYEMSKQWR